MKFHGEKLGNDTWGGLPEEAIRIVDSMSEHKTEIFPYYPAITASFTRACKLLGLEDLNFHDLRHAGISRLFEMGRSIPHIAAVRGTGPGLA